MSIQQDVFACAPGTTDEIASRYVDRHMTDRDHGVPEVRDRVYSALRRLVTGGKLTVERAYSSRNGRATTICVWKPARDRADGVGR